jgi:hypothetical protein
MEVYAMTRAPEGAILPPGTFAEITKRLQDESLLKVNDHRGHLGNDDTSNLAGVAFNVARAIKTILYERGLDPSQFTPRQFSKQIDTFIAEMPVDDDLYYLLDKVWDRALLPEGYNVVTYAFSRAMRAMKAGLGDPVIIEARTPKQVKRAQLIATALGILEWYEAEHHKFHPSRIECAYLSCRTVASILTRIERLDTPMYPAVVGCLFEDLRNAGAIEIRTKGGISKDGHGRATRYRLVPVELRAEVAKPYRSIRKHTEVSEVIEVKEVFRGDHDSSPNHTEVLGEFHEGEAVDLGHATLPTPFVQTAIPPVKIPTKAVRPTEAPPVGLPKVLTPEEKAQSLLDTYENSYKRMATRRTPEENRIEFASMLTLYLCGMDKDFNVHQAFMRDFAADAQRQYGVDGLDRVVSYAAQLLRLERDYRDLADWEEKTSNATGPMANEHLDTDTGGVGVKSGTAPEADIAQCATAV